MYEILFLLSSVFQIYEFYLIMQSFLISYQKSVNKYHVWLGYILFYVLLVIENFMVSIPVINTFTALICLLLLTLLYEASWRKRFLAVVLSFVTMFMAESMLAGVFGYVDADIFGVKEYYSYVGMVCLPIVQFFVVLLFRNINKVRNKIEVPFTYWAVTILLPIITVYLYIQISRQKSISQIDLVCCTVVIFVINIAVVFLYDLQVKAFMMKKEKEFLELQNQCKEKQLALMSDAAESLKKQRHEFRNHLNSISYYGSQKDWVGMSRYLHDIHVKMLEDEDMIDTGSAAFDGVINYKRQEAKEQEITMRIAISIPKDIAISPIHVTTVLGNLLDNSIEAVHSLKEKWIEVKIFFKCNRLNIQICNPFCEQPIEEHGEYVTSKSEKSLHGYGLQNVKTAIEVYEGTMMIDTKNHIFAVRITMFI